jgi:ATP synthase protein I
MDRRRLRQTVQQQIESSKRAERGRRTILSRTAYLGTLGIMLVLPMVAGAYLGVWLDAHAHGFSFSWTISLIVTGVFVGAFNAYWFVRQTWE